MIKTTLKTTKLLKLTIYTANDVIEFGYDLI